MIIILYLISTKNTLEEKNKTMTCENKMLMAWRMQYQRKY